MSDYLKWKTRVMCPCCDNVMIPDKVYKSVDNDYGEWFDKTYGGDCSICHADLYIAREYYCGDFNQWCVKQWHYGDDGDYVLDSPYCTREKGKRKWSKDYQ